MRRLFAVQFEVATAKAGQTLDVAEEALQAVYSWISEWYERRKAVKIEFPTTGGYVTPSPGHEVSVSRDVFEADGVSHSVVSWSYPDEDDGNLLWHSRCEISRFNDLTEFSLELLLESIQFYIAPVQFGLQRPRLVPRILSDFVCTYGGEALSAAPHQLRAQGVPEFVHGHLALPTRRLPIVVVSRHTISEKPLIDPVRLADQLAGFAAVYILEDKWAAYALTSEIGKINSCYNGALRLYWPGFDAPTSFCPIYMPHKVLELGARLPEIIFRQLAAISAFRFVPGPITVDALNFLRERKMREMESIRKKAQDRGDYEDLLRLSDQENSHLREENEGLWKANADLRARAGALEANWSAMLRAHEGDVPGEAEPVAEVEAEPESVEEAVQMARSRFAEGLLFLESATASAKETPFKNAKRVYEALDAMHAVWGQWRKSRRQQVPVGSLKDLFEEKGFDYRPRASKTSKGKWGTEYEAMYDGKKVSIQQHLTLGKGGPDTCLSIHFFTDDQKEKFVIAHVGRHKTNTST